MPAVSKRTLGRAHNGFIRRVFGSLLGCFARLRDQHDLTGLSDHLLDDIGISRAEVEREPSRAFWRVER